MFTKADEILSEFSIERIGHIEICGAKDEAPYSHAPGPPMITIMPSHMIPIADQTTSRRERAIPNPKILLVDDDPNLLRALELRLRVNNYEVVAAGDSYAAITSAEKERPDLIILDLGLPAGDGFVVLERLRKMGFLSTVPVIVLTARDPTTCEQRALNAGATAFFQKPADNNELLNAIRISLNAGEA